VAIELLIPSRHELPNDADDLADLYNELSEAVDDFRLDEKIRKGTPRGQLASLKFLSQKLDDQAKLLRTDEIREKLSLIQAEIVRIRTAAADAKVQFGLLNDAGAAIAIADAGLGAATAITAGKAEIVTRAVDAFVRAAAV